MCQYKNRFFGIKIPKNWFSGKVFKKYWHRSKHKSLVHVLYTVHIQVIWLIMGININNIEQVCEMTKYVKMLDAKVFN